MKLAITGGHGFLGAHVVTDALEHGHEVVVVASPWGRLDRLAAQRDDARLEVRRHDLRSAAGMSGAFDGCDAVVHAAARVADHGSWEAFEAVNVRGTRNVVTAAREAGIARLVFVSSVAVWRYVGLDGVDPRRRPPDRERPGYGRSKRRAETIVNEEATEPVIVRPALWPYGRRDPTLARVVRALRRRQLPLIDGGRARLQTVDARYLARVLVVSAERHEAAGRSYLVADDGVVSWAELLSLVADLAGAPRPRWSLPGGAVAAVAPVVEDGWLRLGLPGEPPLTRYRAELMRSDIVFDASAVRDELDLAPLRDRTHALSDALEALPS